MMSAGRFPCQWSWSWPEVNWRGDVTGQTAAFVTTQAAALECFLFLLALSFVFGKAIFHFFRTIPSTQIHSRGICKTKGTYLVFGWTATEQYQFPGDVGSRVLVSSVSKLMSLMPERKTVDDCLSFGR